MSSFKNLFTLEGKHQLPGCMSPTIPRRSSTEKDNLFWAEVDRGDNASAPNVAGNFGCQKGDVQLELQGGDNLFTLGGGGTLQAPPAGILRQWEELGEVSPATPQVGIPGTVAHGPLPPQVQQAAPMAPYLGMAAAI